jgi:hypothetical protein
LEGFTDHEEARAKRNSQFGLPSCIHGFLVESRPPFRDDTPPVILESDIPKNCHFFR